METAPLNDVMIDIEALALRPGAAIIRLAAATFDPWTGRIGQEFDERVSPDPPFVMDLQTYRWNLDHGNVIEHPDAAAPAVAIHRFVLWLDLVAPDVRERVLWSWGADYDFPLLAPYIDLRGAEHSAPWKYHQQRCARTIWKIAFPGQPSPKRPHDAIGDVRSTVTNVAEAFAVFSAGLKQGSPATPAPVNEEAAASYTGLPQRDAGR
jgi:hypothetical protein